MVTCAIVGALIFGVCFGVFISAMCVAASGRMSNEEESE